jgi:hypothetical protein
MTRTRLLVLSLGLLAIVLPVAAGAQIISGTVVDSATKRPLAGVAVTARAARDSTVVRGGVTDSLGQFRLMLPKPDTVFVTARRIGLEPLETAPRFVSADVERRLHFQMAQMPVMLDTVRSEGRKMLRGFLYSLTAGQEWFARHYRAGKGFFTSAAEIQMSGLHPCDYFGGVPGLQKTRARGIACFEGRTQDIPIAAIAPAAPVPCMDVFVDRRHRLVGMNQEQFAIKIQGIDTPKWLPLASIRGIEVFARYEDRPKDFSYIQPVPPPLREAVGTVRMQDLDGADRARPARFTSQSQAPQAMRCAMMLVWTAQYWGD